MAKITQYSRISHHTLAGSASATFSVPISDDFTDGSWTPNDLALSEIGVNEDAKKAYIRIGSEVKEFSFDPGLVGPTGPAGATGTPGTQSLSQTLAIGNTTGANNIIFNNNQAIFNSTNNAYVAFANELVEIQSDKSSATASLFQVKPDFIYLESADGVGILGSTINASMNGVVINTKDFGYGQTSSIAMTKNTIYMGYVTDNDAWFSGLNIDGTSPQLSLSTGYNSGNLISRFSVNGGSLDGYVGPSSVNGTYSTTTHNNTLWRVLKVEDNKEVADLRVDKDIDGNFRVGVNGTNFSFGTSSTTGYASASAFSLALPNAGDHAWVKVQVKAISSTYSKAYVADMFGGFRNDGSLNLIGTGYSVIEYTDFTSAKAYYDIVGTNMKVVVYGETSSTINWSVNVTWG